MDLPDQSSISAIKKLLALDTNDQGIDPASIPSQKASEFDLHLIKIRQ